MKHRHRILAGAAGALVLALFSGCQPRGSAPAPSGEPQKCTRIGQSCEFSPNKLGSCVLRDNCSEDCLVCQSQH
jgi:hypothetical protein